MSDGKSPSQTRLILAQFLFAHGIDIEALYKSLGAEVADCDAEAKTFRPAAPSPSQRRTEAGPSRGP